MIPKTIHYCWFGRNPKPKLAKKCIKSWKKYCPDYKIIEWNEDNFDLDACPLYVRQAYKAKKWAFVTDYVRLKVVYDHGGVYLDTDVELRKSLDELLNYQAYFGFEDGVHINTGLGFGAESGNALLAELMDDYEDIPFVKLDGSLDTLPCPVRNTEVFLRQGLEQDDSFQILNGSVAILPSVYLCPVDGFRRRREGFEKAYSIHWFSASWYTKEQRVRKNAWIRKEKMDYLIHIPNRILKKWLGNDRYEKLKKIFRR